MKHTQGEWKEQSFDFDNHTKIWITDSHNVQICYLNRFGNGMNFLKRQEANAKLIASAPEMLEALHDISVNLRAIMDGAPSIAIGSSLDKVNRALKKASDVELKNVDYTDAPDVKLTRALT